MFKQENTLWEELIPSGNHWSGLMRRGSALRLTDMNGGANVSALFYNAEDKLERYNLSDTLKAQHTAFLTTGNVCYSDMGRVLCSIIADSTGWHDTICGMTDDAMITQKYGASNYQTARNDMLRSGKTGALIELAKHGLGMPDLTASVNFFSKVMPDDAGNLSFVQGHSAAGSFVDIRFDMNVLVVLNTAPHPLNPSIAYPTGEVKLSAWQAGTPTRDDACRTSCNQNARGFINTERYYL